MAHVSRTVHSAVADSVRRSDRLRRGLANALLAIASIALTVAALEIGFRLANFDFEFKAYAFHNLPIFYRQPTMPFGGGLFRRPGPDEWRGQVLNTMTRYKAWQHKMGADDTYRDEVPVTITYDRMGFRNPPDLSDWDIVVAGDSFTELGHLPYADLFTTHLGELLRLRVKNLGVSFTGTVTQTAYLTEFGRSPSTKEAVVVFFEGNDISDIVLEKLSMQRQLTTNVFEAAQQRNLDLLPRQTSFLRAAYRLVTEGPPPGRLDLVNAYFVWGATERPLTIEFPRSVPPNPSELSVAHREALAEAIKGWGEAARALGLRPWLVYMPCKRRVLEGYMRWKAPAAAVPLPAGLPELIRDLATGAGIEFIDVTPVLRAETAAGRLTYNTVMDSHLNRHGSLLVGRALADALAPAGRPGSRDGAAGAGAARP